MRVLASSSSSPRRPKVSAPVGQTSVHAGLSPTAWRSAQNWHLRTRGVFEPYSYFGMSNGHAIMQ